MPTSASPQRLWEATLGRLQLNLPKPSFDTWLRDTQGLALDDGALTVGVPTTFTAAWLEQRLHGLIEDTVSSIAQGPLTVSYHVRGTVGGSANTPPVPAQLATSASAAPVAQISNSALTWTPNERYTFDSFVVGKSNELAYAASRAVAEAPGQAYNPLFLYGAVGLGKTHLLHAIGLQATELGFSAAYVTTEQFTNEYLASIRERKTEEFRDRYRSVHVLLVDDIQFLSGKESTQEGFFHTFNALRDAGRQVVITCDRLPGALPLLEERLRSRLEWGLVADVGAPDLETRMAILQRHALQSPAAVPDDVIEFIAQRIPSNVRHLESCINRLTALAYFTRQEVTIELAVNAMGAVATQQAGSLSPKAVISAVSTYLNVPTSALLGGGRDKPTANARQVAMYLLRQTLNLSPEQIGKTLGNRDRTTVLYALKQVAKRMDRDAEMASTIAQLTQSLTAGVGDGATA
jgi:chromosomal replication initiator protein